MSSKSKNMPLGVKIISVLYYIGAVVMLLGGLMSLFGAGFVGSLIDSMEWTSVFGGLMMVLGIIFIALAVLSFFLGRGLWKGQSWARILAIIFAVLGVLNALIALISGGLGSIVGLIIHALIGYYLLFNKEAKKAFA